MNCLGTNYKRKIDNNYYSLLRSEVVSLSPKLHDNTVGKQSTTTRQRLQRIIMTTSKDCSSHDTFMRNLYSRLFNYRTLRTALTIFISTECYDYIYYYIVII